MDRDYIIKAYNLHGIARDKIIKICTLKDQVTYLTDYGTLYHTEKIEGKIEKVCNNKFKDFAKYGNNILAIDNKGILFSCTIRNTLDDHGNGWKFFKVELVEQLIGIVIVKIAIGQNQCFAQGQDGKFYEWKNGFKCYDSIGSTCDVKFQEDDMAVMSILYATTYPLVLTKNGKVFLPGLSQERNESHDLPIEKLQMFETTLIDKVEKIETGKKFIFALTDAGEIYMWDKTMEFRAMPQRLNCEYKGFLGRDMWASDKIELLAILGECGSLISLRLKDDGQLLALSNLSHNSAYDFFKDVKIPYNGCIFDGIYKSEETIRLNYVWQKNFESIFNKQDASDISIEVEGKTIYCHKNILNAQCSYLKRMMEYELANKDRICIEDYSYDVYSSFLEYIYTGRLKIKSYENNLDLIKLAHSYMEAELLKYCVVQAINGLSPKWVSTVKDLATLLELQDLIAACKIFIK